VGALLNANDPFSGPLLDGLQQAAAALRIQLAVHQARSPAEYGDTLVRWAGERVGAVFVQPSLSIDRVAELVLAHRLPSISFTRGFVSVGGLVAYAANTSELQRRSVDYVDRILRGADPGRLPIEQSSHFDLLINLRTAKALDLEVPRALRLRASEMIT
jgi:putative ABC transport system substrate-binding protein